MLKSEQNWNVESKTGILSAARNISIHILLMANNISILERTLPLPNSLLTCMSWPQNNLPLSPLTQNLCPSEPFCLCLKLTVDDDVTKLMITMIIFMMEVMIMEGQVMIEMISMITLLTIVLIAD